MKTKLVGFLYIATIATVGMVWLGLTPTKRASAQAEKTAKVVLYAPEGYPEKTNCPDCVKDNADKKEQKRLAATSVITQDFSKNEHYVQPPVPLGDGHALKIELTAPGNIVSVSRGCIGGGCGWTHDMTYQNIGTKTVTWIGWSNAGTNCILTFTITHQ